MIVLLTAIQAIAIGLLPLTLTFWYHRDLVAITHPRIYFTYSDAIFFASDGLALIIIFVWGIKQLQRLPKSCRLRKSGAQPDVWLLGHLHARQPQYYMVARLAHIVARQSSLVARVRALSLTARHASSVALVRAWFVRRLSNASDNKFRAVRYSINHFHNSVRSRVALAILLRSSVEPA